MPISSIGPTEKLPTPLHTSHAIRSVHYVSAAVYPALWKYLTHVIVSSAPVAILDCRYLIKTGVRWVYHRYRIKRLEGHLHVHVVQLCRAAVLEEESVVRWSVEEAAADPVPASILVSVRGHILHGY